MHRWKVVATDGIIQKSILFIDQSETDIYVGQTLLDTKENHISYHESGRVNLHVKLQFNGKIIGLYKDIEDDIAPADVGIRLLCGYAVPSDLSRERYHTYQPKRNEKVITVNVKEFNNSLNIVNCAVYVFHPSLKEQLFDMAKDPKDFPKRQIHLITDGNPHLAVIFYDAVIK